MPCAFPLEPPVSGFGSAPYVLRAMLIALPSQCRGCVVVALAVLRGVCLLGVFSGRRSID